ncbi:SDR family NAD(P)-dependent oxidoreductase [Amycolatopsis sp. cmx-4-68]|uniref:SDR family NAD(P)-dependent oxidoreductase n=1 Tax=Amycolatopsis sp. cmx-4-68 TaxID=2790938 RepID=UPI00397E7605
MTTSIVVGGSGGIGQAIAQYFAERGDTVVVASRDKARAESVAAELGGDTHGLAVDLAEPETIAAAFGAVTEVDNLVLTAAPLESNTIADFDVRGAVRSVTVKLVGYAETVRVLRDRFRPGAAVVLFGGLAKDRPYPGSTVVTTFNAGISGLTRTLAVEIGPYRVNALHPGFVGDSPRWRDAPRPPQVDRAPIGRPVTMAEIVDATDFLLRNTAMTGHDLHVDGGLPLI